MSAGAKTERSVRRIAGVERFCEANSLVEGPNIRVKTPKVAEGDLIYRSTGLYSAFTLLRLLRFA